MAASCTQCCAIWCARRNGIDGSGWARRHGCAAGLFDSPQPVRLRLRHRRISAKCLRSLTLCIFTSYTLNDEHARLQGWDCQDFHLAPIHQLYGWSLFPHGRRFSIAWGAGLNHRYRPFPAFPWRVVLLRVLALHFRLQRLCVIF